MAFKNTISLYSDIYPNTYIPWENEEFFMSKHVANVQPANLKSFLFSRKRANWL
jgi:hypothetical protein